MVDFAQQGALSIDPRGDRIQYTWAKPDLNSVLEEDENLLLDVVQVRCHARGGHLAGALCWPGWFPSRLLKPRETRPRQSRCSMGQAGRPERRESRGPHLGRPRDSIFRDLRLGVMRSRV